MSNNDTAAIPRVGQKGTAFTAVIDEPIPNTDPVQYQLVDLTDADPTNVWIEFKRPDLTTFKKLAFVYTAPANALLRFVDGDGILDQVGDNWEFRGIAGFDDGSEYPGSWTIFPVGN